MEGRRRTCFKRPAYLLISFCFIIFAGCEYLKSSKPLYPIKEYEKLLVGRLDANYVGTANCLKSCHTHNKIRRDFEASTMGAQMSSKSGMPLVDCESCHGPGSLAIKDLTPERITEDEKIGNITACDYKTLINISALPSAAQSLLCLNCHSSNATFNLHEWNSGTHAVEGVTCTNCHNIHSGADLIVEPRETSRMCFSCHEKIWAEFHLNSRHPVLEGKVFCTDCHNPHGTVQKRLLRGDSVSDTCTKCHGQYEGPFAFGHADLNEDCTNCHRPHGSQNNHLLNAQETYLCMQCHTGHKAGDKTETISYYARCTDCHSAIHGSDLPSASGKGKFIN